MTRRYRMEMHVQQFLQPTYSEVGSVEGTLEALILHHDRYFNVYDFLTGKRVRCNFGQRIDLATITEALERRVAVYGTVNVRSNGQPVTMTAEQLDIFPDERDLPTIDSVTRTLEESMDQAAAADRHKTAAAAAPIVSPAPPAVETDTPAAPPAAGDDPAQVTP